MPCHSPSSCPPSPSSSFASPCTCSAFHPTLSSPCLFFSCLVSLSTLFSSAPRSFSHIPASSCHYAQQFYVSSLLLLDLSLIFLPLLVIMLSNFMFLLHFIFSPF